ncbi:TPA: isoprenylcysteine carboxylmethyltransferase family protein [Pseudomonas aeruginosa]
MNHDAPAYGLWLLVLVNSAVFIMFAFSFFKPQTSRDWRTFGTFAAFIVALFVEMYGFPLTLYVLSGWLQTKYPSLDLLSHNSGHLWSTLLGESGPYARIRHPQYVAFVAILFGFLLQWPTLLTLLMFPFLVVMYSRLAVNEEKDMRKQFGAEFDAYAARTPRFLPSLSDTRQRG